VAQFRSILLASIIFAISAFFTWGLAIAGIWWNLRTMPLIRAAAATATILAAVLWSARSRKIAEREREIAEREREALLIKTLAALVPVARTGPQAALRRVQ